MPNDAPHRFACPACNKRLSAPARSAGKETPCPGCGVVIVVPFPKQERAAPSEPGASAAPAKDPAPAKARVASAERVSFGCRICGTRLSVPVRRLGEPVKCPDCHTLTESHREEAKQAPRRPAAMDGDQYELYEGEEQPWAADLIAAEPERIGVDCGLCRTRMYAPPSALGELLVCPDCGTKTRVEPPVAAPRPASPPAVEGYALDETPAPAGPQGPGMYESLAANPPAGYRELAESRRRRAGRPAPPRGTMFRGVFRIWRGSMPALALGLMAASVLAAWLFCVLFTIISRGGMAAGYGIVFLPPATIVGFLFGAVFSVVFVEQVVESSEGNDNLDGLVLIDLRLWIGPITYLAVATAAAAGPGSLVGAFLLPEYRLEGALLGGWLLFPWVVLSQLEQSSALAVFSPKLPRTLRYAPGAWLAYYLQTGLMLVGLVGLARLAAPHLHTLTAVAVAPAATLCLLLTARLLGLLSWIAAHATPDRPEQEGPEQEGPVGG